MLNVLTDREERVKRELRIFESETQRNRTGIRSCHPQSQPRKAAMSNIYIANNYNQSVYAMVTKSTEWTIADFLTNIAMFAVGIGEIKAAVSVADLPATINTVQDLFKVMKVAAQLLGGTATTGSRSAEAALTVVKAFKASSVQITPGQYKNVYSSDVWTYFNPSAYADLMGASTMTLLLMSDDGKNVIEFDTNSDYSWVATSSGVVRSQYGTIWTQDPNSGSFSWGHSD
jgi:hypothetical protein